jgi:LysM repeat protein
MSRKDTIIVAVLVNAGLLIVLFASALKSSAPESQLVMKQESVEAAPISVKKEGVPVMGDEVDAAFAQFSKEQKEGTSQELVAMPMTPPNSSNAFVDDLKMITQVEETGSQSLQDPTVQTLMAPLAKEQKLVPNTVEVKVKKGDVLEKIARHNHSSVAEIMKANHLTTSNLRIGQVLKVPQKTTLPSSSTVSHSAQAAPRMYTIKKGDSPWTIAVKHKMKVEDLLKLNNLSETESKRLKPGDQLRIQ